MPTSITTSVSFNLESVAKQLGIVMESRLAVAVKNGINRTANSEKVALARAVASDMGVKVTTVKDEIKVRLASVNDLRATVSSTGTRLPLIEFNAKGPVPSRGQGRGVTYRIGAGGRRRLPHAFIATMRSGHAGVFQRRGTKRLPINEAFGPSIAHVFSKQIPIGEARREEVLVKNVQHEIEFALSKSA